MSLDLVKVGAATVTSSDTIVIPIDVDVAASDPTLGATILLAVFQLPSTSFAAIASATDDAPANTGPYNGCLFDDGLNHYTISAGNTPLGLILNPLIGGTNSLTLTFNTSADFIACNVYAITGVNLPIAGTQSDPPDWLISPPPTAVLQQAEAPVGGGSGLSSGPSATWDSGGTIHLHSPAGSSDENWDWVTGELALYIVSDNTATGDEAGWTWDDGSISDFDQYDYDGGDGHFYSQAVGTKAVTPGAAGPSLDGSWGSGDNFFTGVFGYAFLSGPGPEICIPPPPPSGIPTFNVLVPV